MDLHKSTVSRTMDTLERRGFVQKDSETGKYWLGLQVYALGMLFREKDTFPKVAYPYAKALSRQCNEGVHITTFAHNEASYPQHIILEKIKSPRTIDTAPPIGAVRPAYCSASGKCLLAFSPEYLHIYTGCALQKFTEYTVTDWGDLLQELEKVRCCGYAVEQNEVELGMACIAAPISIMAILRRLSVYPDQQTDWLRRNGIGRFKPSKRRRLILARPSIESENNK